MRWRHPPPVPILAPDMVYIRLHRTNRACRKLNCGFASSDSFRFNVFAQWAVCVSSLALPLGCGGSNGDPCALPSALRAAACDAEADASARDAGLADESTAGNQSTADASVDQADAALADAAATDSGQVEAGPCGLCPIPTPHCAEASLTCVACREGMGDCADPERAYCVAGECVACRADGDCAANPEQPFCVERACVGCRSDTDCQNARPVCDPVARACTGCDSDAQCEARGQICFVSPGTCEDCLPDKETQCGSKSCNPRTLRCTNTNRGSVGACGTCASTSECEANHACVEPHRGHGFHCVPRRGPAGCDVIYSRATQASDPIGKTHDVCVYWSGTRCGAIRVNRPCGRSYDPACPAGSTCPGLAGPKYTPWCRLRCERDDDCSESQYCRSGICEAILI